jgi:predicted enzyme related to lactoylglutathione lyase
MDHDWARPVVHWEIESRDPERLRSFYGELFNWAITDGPIMFVEPGIGGPEPGPGGHFRHSERNGVNLFIQVRDLQDSLRRVPQLGGEVLSEALDVPGGPTLATVADPDGNSLVLVQQ